MSWKLGTDKGIDDDVKTVSKKHSNVMESSKQTVASKIWIGRMQYKDHNLEQMILQMSIKDDFHAKFQDALGEIAQNRSWESVLAIWTQSEKC